MRLLDNAEAEAALTSCLPAGTQTVQMPSWTAVQVAGFQLEHLLELGYSLVDTRDKQ